MRIIKFKYWNTVAKRWEKGAGYAFNEQGFMGSSDILPVQFTGLKDKNGKEIYEGDIVQHVTPAVKKMSDKEWSALPKGTIIGAALAAGRCEEVITEKVQIIKGDTHPFDPSEEYGYKANKWEIIGNLYENPELLK